VLKEEFNNVSSGNSGSTRNEMCELSEMIFDNENTIKFVGKRQARNKVKRDLQPRERVRRNRIEKTQRRSCGRFIDLTARARRDKSRNVVLKTWPDEILCNIEIGFTRTKMTTGTRMSMTSQ
jgi:hypothetical protein